MIRAILSRIFSGHYGHRNFGLKPKSPHALRPRVRVRIQIGGVETTQ